MYRQIGQLSCENDFLKKFLGVSVEKKMALIDQGNGELSIRQQCDLLDLNRSTLYYQPAQESPENILLILSTWWQLWIGAVGMYLAGS